MVQTLQTKRLQLGPLITNDAAFIHELVNSPTWVEFIGNRNVTNLSEAQTYIQRILENPQVHYWVVRLRSNGIPMGVVTFIKRDYLEHHDIGFALLPSFAKKGYAYEATGAILDYLLPSCTDSHILATTLPENVNSIRLLQKLGFAYKGEINKGSEFLHLYSIAVKKAEPSFL